MPEPSPDPLIAPWISQLAAHLKSGKITPEGLSRPWTDKWTWLPPALLPFVESPSVSTLAAVLKAHPLLYWHPLVFRQIRYLLRLRRDKAKWEQLGWEMQLDEDGLDEPPKEVKAVYQWLEQLVEAHVSGIFLHRQIKGERQERRGPKSGFKNPYPAGGWAEWVHPADLDSDERNLRKRFSAQRQELKRLPRETVDEARIRIQRLAQEALEHVDIWWSGLNEYVEIEEPVPQAPPTSYTCHHGPSAPTYPQGGDLWLDTSVKPYTLKKYEAASATWITAATIQARDVAEALELVDFFEGPISGPPLIKRWNPLNLGDNIDRMLRPSQMGRVGADGKPAYLAYAVLGALVGVTPEKIKDTLDNYRHPRHRKGMR
jgi:hypothetical protein